MADEVTDSLNTEQFLICIHWIDEHLQPHESFVKIHHIDTIEVKYLV